MRGVIVPTNASRVEDVLRTAIPQLAERMDWLLKVTPKLSPVSSFFRSLALAGLRYTLHRFFGLLFLDCEAGQFSVAFLRPRGGQVCAGQSENAGELPLSCTKLPVLSLLFLE